MDDDRFIPYVWRWSWWRQRLPAASAVALALTFAYGGSLGWWVVEERTATSDWYGVDIWPYGDSDEANPGETGVFIGRFMLLPCAVVWLWAPFGGSIGRVGTLILFGYFSFSMLADIPTFVADSTYHSSVGETVVMDALLGRHGWERHGFEATRSTDSFGDLVIGEFEIVALRERVQPGATLSLAAAVGGVAVSMGSLLRWLVSTREAVPAPTSPDPIEYERWASGSLRQGPGETH